MNVFTARLARVCLALLLACGALSAQVQLQATGTPPITWAVISGTLPPGISLSADGVLSGTPTTPGTYSFTVRASNAQGSDTKTFSLTIHPAPTAAGQTNISSLTDLGTYFAPYSGAAGTTVINQEWERYQPFNATNFVFTQNSLDITATIPSGGGLHAGGINSGQIWSKETFVPGRQSNTSTVANRGMYAFETWAKIPPGDGMWPAQWWYSAYPSGDTTPPCPACGTDGSEIDDPEFFGNPSQWTGFQHGPGVGSTIYDITSGGYYTPGTNFSSDYHYYQLVWTGDAVYKYIDGLLIFAQHFTYSSSGDAQWGWDLAVGSDNPSLPRPTSLGEFPATLSIRSMKAWYGTTSADPSTSASFNSVVSALTPLRNYQFGSLVGSATINSFTASSAAISPGSSTTLSWSTNGATVVSIDQGIGPVTGTSSKTVSPSATTTYKLTATGPGGSTTASVVVRVQVTCAPGTPQPTAMPGAAPTDTNLFVAADHASTTLSAAVDATTLTLPVLSTTSATAPTANEIGLLFMNPNGFAESAAGAVVFPAKSPSTGASSSALKIMHGRFHIFMPADDSTWAWFPYSSFTSYAATQAAAGHPLLVTATYGGTHRPVYFSPSLGLDGSNRPTVPSSNWRRLVKTDDPNFVTFWVNNYVRPIAYSQVSGQSNLWMGLDECYFIWNTFGVIDDSGVFQNVTSFDSPFPQNQAGLLTMLRGFFSQLKSIAPDIPVMPNLASGISDIMLDDPTQFSTLYASAAGVMVENIYTPSATDDFSRGSFLSNIFNIYNFAQNGKTELLRANIPASGTTPDATASRTALITYLLVRGQNTFYAPDLGTNPSTDITAENPSDYKTIWNTIGNPTGALTNSHLGGLAHGQLYSRTTQNGIIYLNWTGSSQTVTLPSGNYLDHNGNPVTTLTIPDTTGDYAVLAGGGQTSAFVPFQIAALDSEQIKLCATAAGTLTACSRGFAGTAAAPHAQGALTRGVIAAVYHNQAVAEVIATQQWISTSAHPGGFGGTAITGASWPNHVATIPELYWMTDHAQALLTSPLSATATFASVDTGSCYHAGQIVLSDNELYEIGSVSGNTISGLTRGIGGTTPGAHATGASVFGVIATLDWSRLMQEAVATEQDLFGRAGSTQSAVCSTHCSAATGVSWPNHAVTMAELTGNVSAGGTLSSAMWNRFAKEWEAFTADLKAHP